MMSHAEGIADPVLAQVAYNALGQPGGLRMVVDPDPQAALSQMGLTPVPIPDPI